MRADASSSPLSRRSLAPPPRETSPDPEDLLLQVRRGDASRLGPLLELFRNYLVLLARTQVDRHLKRRVSASDVVQETYLEAFRDFPRFRGRTERELLAWLRRILIHTIARLVEREILAGKRDVRREVSFEERAARLECSAAKVEAALVSSWSSPTSRVRRREEVSILADQLGRLPGAFREVIILRNLEGLSFNEVAERMGRTPGAARMLWLRALGRLRELLEAAGLV